MNAKRTIFAALLALTAVGCFDSDDASEPYPGETESAVIQFDLDVAESKNAEGGDAGMGENEGACLGSLGCACEMGACADGLTCIAGTCGPCPAGQLGCGCEGNTTCDLGLVCVDGRDGNVCALETDAIGECDHGLAITSDGIVEQGACVASCSTDSECDWLACSEANGFCVAEV